MLNVKFMFAGTLTKLYFLKKHLYNYRCRNGNKIFCSVGNIEEHFKKRYKNMKNIHDTKLHCFISLI